MLTSLVSAAPSSIYHFTRSRLGWILMAAVPFSLLILLAATIHSVEQGNT